ncbi:hypothetical protein D9615_010359 [Tricholomella constricta]|uniref:Transposase n=1 Tax=Tricholomella constricta TaxID=117010 RepID=A0A8H5LSY1_9AGAR|nr:hypothetical protein D9615_010359 [Tricholomella constricta]
MERPARLPCTCQQCRQHPEGFIRQTKQLIKKHRALYPVEPSANVLPIPRAVSPSAASTDGANDWDMDVDVDPELFTFDDLEDDDLKEDDFEDDDFEDDDQWRFRDDFIDLDVGPNEGWAEGELWDDGDALEHMDEEQGMEPRPEAAQLHEQAPPLAGEPFEAVHLPYVLEPGQDLDDRPSLIPRAFLEEPQVRLAYLQAVKSNVYGHLTVQQATENLNSTLDALLVAGALPELPRPVRTLSAAKARLGIDPDLYITQYTLCPVCWKHFTPKQMADLVSSACPVTDCTGILFQESYNKKNQCIRTPYLINPQVSIIESLRRMFMRPGWAKSLKDSRPTEVNQINRNDNEDFVMKDMDDATEWYNSFTNTVRQVGDMGTVRDVPLERLDNAAAPRLTDHRYGLHLTLNADWFGLLDGRPHSAGPIYISINDLPREDRLLQVNTICQSILPGPKEPNPQQLENCLEPAVKEIAILKNGVKMDIHEEDEQGDVFVDLFCLNCDTPALRKFDGVAGHAHDMHPCPYCDTTLLDVNEPAGYDRNNAHDLERQYINSIIRNEARQRGGMVTQIAVFQAEAKTDGVKLPKHQKSKFIDLRSLHNGQVYGLVLAHLQQVYPDLNLIDDHSQAQGTPFWGRKSTTSVSYIRKHGLRYGCASNTRTQADSFAFITRNGARVPVQLHTLLVVTLAGRPPHVCALIRRLSSDENLPDFPWDLFASVLGIHVAYADTFEAFEVVPVSVIDAPLGLIPVHSNTINRDLWVFVSFDHTGAEPEDFYDDDDELQ